MFLFLNLFNFDAKERRSPAPVPLTPSPNKTWRLFETGCLHSQRVARTVQSMGKILPNQSSPSSREDEYVLQAFHLRCPAQIRSSEKNRRPKTLSNSLSICMAQPIIHLDKKNNKKTGSASGSYTCMMVRTGAQRLRFSCSTNEPSQWAHFTRGVSIFSLVSRWLHKRLERRY